MSSRPVTLRDIAERTGFGLATVSRALGRRPKVAPATREAVLEAAEALGYRPDPAMRHFVKRRWPQRQPSRLNVAVLAPRRVHEGRTEADRMIDALGEVAEEAGFQLIPFAMDEMPTAAALRRRARAQGISGWFVPPMPAPGCDLSPLYEEFPAVLCAPAEYSPALPVIGPDDYLRSKHAWEHVRGRGYRRIGIVMPDHPPAESVDARMSGLLIGWSQQNPLIPIFRFRDEGDRADLQEWYRAHRPDAIIGYDAAMAGSLVECGIPCGGAVGYAALHLFRESERGRFPGSFYSRGRICRRAWERLEFMILNRLPGAALGDTKELIDMPYDSGESL